MNPTPRQKRSLAAFPRALRGLIEAELAAGNAIAELGQGFPAPPVRAFCRLARRVGTCPRASSEELDFFERNSLGYSGEFTDARRCFFVLEPPNPLLSEPAARAGTEWPLGK